MEEEKVVRVKELFGDYLDLLDNRKTINDQIKDAVDSASDTLNIKSGIVRKLFAAMKKSMEGNEEFDELKDLMEELNV